jgi:hypothetical protein
LKDKNELSKTFSQWLTITKYHPSTIIRADKFSVVHNKSLKIPKGQSEIVRVSGSCSTCGTCRVNLVTNPVISKIFQVMTSNLPKGTLGSVASLLAATLYQENPDRDHKLWYIVSSERYILHMKSS